MWEWINETVMSFRKCFRREAAFKWFVVVVIGMMIWKEHLGVSSLVRELWIDPRHYETLLHFYRSSAWNLEGIRNQWMQTVKKAGVMFEEEGMPILVGDGTKQAKEGKRMPCVKKLYQESENSAKPAYMYGHMFGAIGVLVGGLEKLFCLPLSITIHDGDKQINGWKHSQAEEESHVQRLIRQACQVASKFVPSILLLDRYFLSVPALTVLAEEEKRMGRPLLSIVTKAKSNAVAYEKPVRKTGRGRPPLKGKSIKLNDLFKQKERFTQATVQMYGVMESVSYLCVDLLWGQKLYRELRFVLVLCGNQSSILVSTNLNFSPLKIIRLYSYRFKIECCFRELKQVIAGLAYRFWSRSMPLLDRHAKPGTDPLATLTQDYERKRIINTYNATHGFVMFACIAMGLLQICALQFSNVLNASPIRWLRTRTNRIPSEATTADFLRKSIFRMLHLKPGLPIFHFIRELQFPPNDLSLVDLDRCA